MTASGLAYELRSALQVIKKNRDSAFSRPHLHQINKNLIVQRIYHRFVGAGWDQVGYDPVMVEHGHGVSTGTIDDRGRVLL